MKKLRLLGAVSAAAVITSFAVPVHAATSISQSQTFLAQPNASLVFDLFDPTLGTLNFIEFSLISSFTNTVEGQVLQPDLEGNIVIVTSDVTLLFSTAATETASLPGAAASCRVTNGGCTWFPTTLTQQLGTDRTPFDLIGQGMVQIPNPSGYIGPGTFGLDLSVVSSPICDPFDSSCSSHSESWSGTVQLDYLFNPSPVPVPAAVWLFGSGLIGLIGIARRKNA